MRKNKIAKIHETRNYKEANKMLQNGWELYHAVPKNYVLVRREDTSKKKSETTRPANKVEKLIQSSIYSLLKNNNISPEHAIKILRETAHSVLKS